MMAALFSCTRCHKRHPFEELSQSEQLCKECRNNFPVVKCTYCRGEFQQEDKGSTNSVCKKCAQNVKVYGKPTACEYCNIIAAFIGNKCQRCTNSEKKYGPPQTCEQCKQKCAFDRSEESRKKDFAEFGVLYSVLVDGKLLCWLCSLAYRRVLARTSRKDDSQKTDKSGQSSVSSDEQKQPHPKHHNHQHSSKGGEKHGHKRSHSHAEKHSDDEKKIHGEHKKHHHHHHHHRHHHRKEGEDGSKRPKMESKSTSNGFTPSRSVEQTFVDPSSTDHVIAITQLRDEVEKLKKQLKEKDQGLIEKEKKLTELKAKHYELEKEMRDKKQAIEKDYKRQLDELQTKNRALQKQVASLSKGKDKRQASSQSPT